MRLSFPKWVAGASPLNGPAVREIEEALSLSPTKTIRLEINSVPGQLSREGRWLKFSLLSKKGTVKRAALFATVTDFYNQMIHGQVWRIAQA